MAKIPVIQKYDITLTEVDKILEREKMLEAPRHYLGMSEIGDECWRKLFYSFRNVSKKQWPASNIRAIEDGFVQEDVMALRLRKIPIIELHTNVSEIVDNTIGKRLITQEDNKDDQIGFQLLLGHLCGHCDGVIKGLLEAPQTWHVWEHKSVNDKKFDELLKLREAKGEKNALEAWDIIYYAQAQLYMHELKMDRHFLTVTKPGGRQYISIRTEYNKKYAEMLIEKGKAIIFDNWNAPAKLSEDCEYYKCKYMCAFVDICHHKDFPLVHCKTCRYSEPANNGERMCLLKDEIISESILHIGCDSHIYNPALVQAKLIDQNADGCIYHVENEDIYFANTNNLSRKSDQWEELNVYTSKDLKEKIKSINNLSQKTMKVQKKFNGTMMKEKDIPSGTVVKAWEKKEIDPRLKDI